MKSESVVAFNPLLGSVHLYRTMVGCKMDFIECLVLVAIIGTCRSFTTEPNQDSAWGSFGNKTYLFVMDVGRRQDLNYYEAKQRCIQSGTSGLVTVDTDSEFEFLRKEIQRRVVSSGQEFAHEQWWTAGMAATSVEKAELDEGESKEKNLKTRRNSTSTWKKANKKPTTEDKANLSYIPWVWDSPGNPTVNVSALKRRTLPKKGVHYLAISHGHGLDGWRLRSLPANYRLRYICQKYTPASSQKSESLMEPLRVQLRPSITVHLNFTQFISFNEVKLILCSKVKVLMRWNDTGLQMNDSLNSNHSSSHYWIPHVEFTNSLRSIGSTTNEEPGKARLSEVRDEREAEYMEEVCSHCIGDGFLFPYDKYICSFQLVASNSAFIQSRSSFTASEAAIQWPNHLCLSEDSSKNLKSNDGSNSTRRGLEFRVEFKRHLTFYALILLGPTGLITLPLMFLLKLPVEKCIKIPSIVVMISVFTLQIQFICTLSPKSQRFVVPLIVFYPIAMLTISVISVPINIAFYRSRNHSSPHLLVSSKACRANCGCSCCCCSKPIKQPVKTASTGRCCSSEGGGMLQTRDNSDKEVPFSLTICREPSLLLTHQTPNLFYDRRPFYASCILNNRKTDSQRLEYRKLFHQTLPSRGSSSQKFETSFTDVFTPRSTNSSFLETPSHRQTSQSTDELFSAFDSNPRPFKTLVLNRNVYVGGKNSLARKPSKTSLDVSLANINNNTNNKAPQQPQQGSKSSKDRRKFTATCVDNFLVSLVLFCFISYFCLIAYGWLS